MSGSGFLEPAAAGGGSSLVLPGVATAILIDDGDGTVSGSADGTLTAGGLATFTGLVINGNIAVTGTVDGRDVAADGSKLDGIEATADVTDVINVAAALSSLYILPTVSDVTIKNMLVVDGDGSLSSIDPTDYGSSFYGLIVGAVDRKHQTVLIKSGFGEISTLCLTDSANADWSSGATSHRCRLFYHHTFDKLCVMADYVTQMALDGTYIDMMAVTGVSYNPTAVIRFYPGDSPPSYDFVGGAGALKAGGAEVIRLETDKLGVFGATAVTQPAKINDPAGGGTVDAEARTAVNALIDALESLGLLANT